MKKGGSREFARRNFIAKDLHTQKYGPRIKETKRSHLIDELHEKDALDSIHDFLYNNEDDYDFNKHLGLASKE